MIGRPCAFGRRALRLLASGVGEAGEEVFSGFVDPALEAILDGTTGYNRDTISEVAHSALVGGILGLLGGGVQTVKNAANIEKSNKVDNADTGSYTENDGGVHDGRGEAGAELDGAAGEGVRGQPGVPADHRGAEGRRALGQGDVSGSGILQLSERSGRIIKEQGIAITELRGTSEAAAFSAFLDEARQEDAANGWAVTPQSSIGHNAIKSEWMMYSSRNGWNEGKIYRK